MLYGMVTTENQTNLTLMIACGGPVCFVILFLVVLTVMIAADSVHLFIVLSASTFIPIVDQKFLLISIIFIPHSK